MGGEHPLPRTTATILEHALWMSRQAYRPTTIKATVKTLKALGKRCNFHIPSELKAYIATAAYSENRKYKIISDVDRLYKQLGIKWERPLSRQVETLPFIPTEEEINQLVGGLGPKLATFMMLVKDTYARACEAFNLKWTDLDLNTNSVTVAPEKGSKPRRIKLKNQTVAAMLARPKRGEYIFHSDQATDFDETYRNFYRNFAKQRARIPECLQNSRIRRISFKTLRHYGGTREYARTKDLLFVKERLGHRSITSTLKYIHLIPFKEDECVVKATSGVEEAKQLLESGFDHVTTMDGIHLFRKRK